MKSKLNILLLLFLTTFICEAQKIEVTEVIFDQLEVCRTSQIGYNFTNTYPDDLQNIVITISMSKGLVYESGSVVGATEVDISNPRVPVFEITSLVNGLEHELTLDISLDCEARELIDMGVDFVDTLRLQHSSNNEFYLSNPRDILTPHLVLDLPASLIDIAPYQPVERSFKIRNNRRGKLERFRFVDNHDDCTVSSKQGNIIIQNSTQLIIELGANDFKKIGNGDEYFDKNEELILTEEIIYQKDCETTTLRFDISIDWGCSGEICQDQTGQLVAEVNEIFGEALLDLTGQSVYPDCPCDLSSGEQSLYIHNTGTSPSDEAVLEIRSRLGVTKHGILDSPFWYFNEVGDSINLKVLDRETYYCDSIYYKYFLELPDIEVNDTLEVHWYYTKCSSVNGMKSHEPFGLRWTSVVTYKDKCGDEIKESMHTNASISPRVSITPTGINQITTHGQIYPYINEFKGDIFTEYQHGQITLLYNLPCGFTYGDNDYNFGGVYPIFVDTISERVVHLVYRLPLPSSAIKDTFYAVFNCEAECLDTSDFIGYYKQNTSCPEETKILRAETKSAFCVNALYSNCPFEDESDICGYISDPASQVIAEVFCETGDSLTVNIPGYVDFEGNVERTSFGLADDDNNRFPDLPIQKATKEKLDLKSVIEQDTFKISLKGKIISDYADIQYDSLFVSYDLNPKLFKRLGNQISILDASEGKWYNCQSYKIDLDSGGIIPFCGQTVGQKKPTARGYSVIFHPSYLKTLNCGIPDDFFFEEGDSILVGLDFVFDATTRYRNGTPASVESAMYLYDNDFEHYPFSCGSFKENLNLVKLNYRITPVNEADIQACKSANSHHFFKLIPNPGNESSTNLFPFEYRNIISLDSFQISFDQAITVDSFVVRYVYKDSFPKFDIIADKITIIPVKLNDTTWAFDQHPILHFDDGYEIIIEPYISVKDCHDLVQGLSSTSESVVITTNNVVPYFYFESDVKRDTLFYKKMNLEIDLEDNYYQLFLDIPQLFVAGYDDKARWKANIMHDDSLKFFKFKILQHDVGLSDFRILDDRGETYFEKNNEILVQDYFPHSIKELTVIADNNSCEKQNAQIIAAWACDTLDDFFAHACAIDTFNLSVKSDTPRLGFEINLIHQPYELCDTLDYIEIRINNADKGAAFDLQLDMKATEGFKLISDQLQYELDDNGVYHPLSAPIEINNNHYRWILTDSVTEFIENGFPGEGQSNHSISIQIIGTLDCDFDPGSMFSFEVKGKNNCGLATNNPRITKTIEIEGVRSIDNIILLNAFVQPQELLCADLATIKVDYNATNNFSPEDKLNISIPTGMTFIAGSVRAISNFNVIPPRINLIGGKQILEWNVSDVSSGFKDILFEFDISVDQERLVCESYWLDIKFIHESTVYCKTTNDSCFVNLVAAMKSVPISINKGEVQLLEFERLEQINDSTLYTCIKLLGKWGFLSLWTDSINFNLYTDQRNDGVTPDDQLINSISKEIIFQRGDTVLVCMEFVGNVIDPTCHYIIEISNRENCICNSADIRFDQNIPDKEYEHVLCPHDSISIGAKLEAGLSYQWSGPDLPCLDCPNFEIYHDFNTDTSLTRTYTLTISDSFECSYNWVYNINFLPVFNPDLLDYNICFEDSIILHLKGVNSVLWSNRRDIELMSNPAIIYPKTSSQYYVTFIDSNGCTGIDSFDVNVNRLDTQNYKISNDTTIEPGGEAQLWIKGKGNFVWTPDESLDCSDCSHPLATPERTTRYTVTITDSSGCTAVLRVSVFILEPPCDPSAIFVPNVFSPNNDGNNDQLFVFGNYIDEMYFVIYDRWGEKVFESRDQNIPWDGRYKNKLLAPDVYAYYLKVLCIGGEEYVEKGNVSIIR